MREKTGCLQTCLECKRQFYVQKWLIGIKKFCSQKCYHAIGHRFFSKFVTHTGGDQCWDWIGSKDKNGYGIIKWGKERRAHRISWIIYKRNIPDGMLVLHKCDNPSCVNPFHLFIGDWNDNMQDKTRKGRNNPPYGERTSLAKLTTKQVLEIRRIHAAKEMTQRAIAKQFGVGFKAINKIVLRLRWKHV